MTKVTVNYQHTLHLDGKAHGDVHGQECLSAARIEGGDDKDILVLLWCHHKVHVGTQHTEGLVDHIAVAFFHYHGFRIKLDHAADKPFTLVREVLRDFTDDGHSEALKVFPATDYRIGVLADNDDDNGYQETQGECHKQDVFPDRGCRQHTAVGLGDDTGIVGGECLRKLVLLTLLQQLEVKRLLYFLLTFHTEQVFCLLGVGGYL